MKVTRLVAVVLSVSVILGCGEASVNADSETRLPDLNISFKDTGNVATFSQPIVRDGNTDMLTPVTGLGQSSLNPRHGEPGHRCDIPVGQPLNNKPVKHLVAPETPIMTAVPASTNSISLHPAPIINPNFRTVGNNAANFSSPSSTAGLNPAHGQPGHRCEIPVGSPLNSTPSSTKTSATSTPLITPTTNSTAVAPGMNPAHGQPGHRCDIAVGKPLNSTPSATSTTPNNGSTNTPPATSTKTNSVVAPGMNPAHGQPGHRCDIAVGKPLNSVKSTNDSSAATSSADSSTSNTSPAITPAITSPTADSSTVASGLNPPHGKPGHRCDIQSGKPLSSSPLPTTTSPTKTSPVNTSTTNDAAVAPGMNPPHGKPGHRCDIQTGKPLNSSPSTATSPAKTSAVSTPTKNDVAVAAGMNPAHGKPGHRCDIPVGNPLTSKPVKK